MERWTLEWDRGRADIVSAGAMLYDLAFRLADGRAVAPLAAAPWRNDANVRADAALPMHLRILGGEWPCVPFGTTPDDPEHHGFGTNADWRLVDRDDRSLRLECFFPPGHAVERLEREVRAVPEQARLDMTLSVTARRDCVLPIGLHPIFRLPEGENALHVRPGGFGEGEVFPVVFEPGVSRLRPGARFAALGEVETADGASVSLEALPAAGVHEELVQLWDADGTMLLEDREAGTTVRLSWDPAAFPHCILWISDRGRSAKPWAHRFRGLGVEPVAAAFDRADLAPGARGRATGRRFAAGERWTTRYRLEAS